MDFVRGRDDRITQPRTLVQQPNIALLQPEAKGLEISLTHQREAWPDGRVVVERRELRHGAAAGGADGGLRADESLHALQRGRRLPPHKVAAHQSLQLHQRLERPQRLLRLQGFYYRYVYKMMID